MRLTLRTMLAYLDDLLEADDAQEIGKKIEESERATGLMHRIRDVVRRLRLAAPPLGDQVSGLDANTVAEYLDNTLPSDRVADVEKVCLESDVHLAEVASCHQVLTMVLGEPAEVDPISRQRMYQLPDLVAAQGKAATETAAAETPELAVSEEPDHPEVKATPRRARPAIPDYLRAEAEASRRRWSIVMAVFLVACLGVVGWGVLSSSQNPLGTWLGLGPKEKSAATAKSSKHSSTSASEKTKETTPDAASKEKEAVSAAPPVVVDLPEIEEPASSANQPAPVSKETETGATASVAKPEMSPLRSPAAEPPKSPFDGQAAEDAPTPDSAGISGPVGASEASGPSADLAMRPAPEETRSAGENPPLAAEHSGQYVSPREVLLKAEGDVLNWVRLPDQAILTAGDRCVSLPTFRPVVMLGDDLHLQLIDAAHVLFLPNEPREVEKAPGILVDHGRLVISTEGKAKTGLRVQVGERRGIVRFTDDPATLALNIGRGTPSNADPETHPAPMTAEMYVTRGRILWQDIASREVISFDAPIEVSLASAPATGTPLKSVPTWIDAATMDLLEQRASITLEKGLEMNRPALLTLRELADHRQKEVRWLAMRCLATIGDFQLMVTALDDPEQRSMWTDYVELLRQAVQRSPLAAAQVRGAIERVYSSPSKMAAGASLYELLWRYQPEGLSAADASSLVGYLESETLAVRVLAYWNLKNITGLGLYYRPEDPAPRREAAVQKWKDRLRASPTLRARGDEAVGAPSPAAGKRDPAPKAER